MKRYEYYNAIDEILDKALNELSSEEYELLLNDIEDMIDDRQD